MTRRLGIVLRLNPYNLWDKRSIRQLLSLGQSYKDLHATEKNAADSKILPESESRSSDTPSDVKVPSWYVVPKGARLFDIDTIEQGDV